MACEYCNWTSGHPSSCPNADEPISYGKCELCGEDIYEGDIIRSFDSNGNSIYHHIEYRGASFVAILKIDNFAADAIESTLTQDWLNEFDKVIIGNIHDDKDYLIK